MIKNQIPMIDNYGNLSILQEPITKREHFALEILKQVLNSNYYDNGVERSVKLADKLIEELEK